MNNVFAGIVAYNPNIETLKENIKHIINQVDCVVIFDNGSINFMEYMQNIANIENVILIKENQNKGIAYGLQQICTWGIKNGYDWVLTLDQDSICPENLIKILMSYTKDERIAIVAPTIIYKNNEDYFEDLDTEIQEVDWVITSASLTKLCAVQDVGGFDVSLFIDKVDVDFCIRLRLKGYKVLRVASVKLLHELGNLKCRKLFGKVIYVTNHSAFRIYYMIRNSIIIKKKLSYGNPTYDIIKIIIKILIYEDKKSEKMKQVVRGMIDGIKLNRSL